MFNTQKGLHAKVCFVSQSLLLNVLASHNDMASIQLILTIDLYNNIIESNPTIDSPCAS